jgi:hypothetical protein
MPTKAEQIRDAILADVTDVGGAKSGTNSTRTSKKRFGLRGCRKSKRSWTGRIDRGLFEPTGGPYRWSFQPSVQTGVSR